MAKVFVCKGACGAVVTIEKYEQGLTKCGAKHCDQHGKPFQPIEQCPDCSVKFASGVLQTCVECRPM